MLDRLQASVKTRGLKATLGMLAGRVFRNLFVERLKVVEDTRATRQRLANRFFQDFGGVVRYGPISGFRISQDSWWGGPDRAAKLFGLYEQEVLETLESVSPGRSVFIDIGAADGYFGVSMVSSGLFSKSFCFERSDAGRRLIAETARLNDVSDDVIVLGDAAASTLADIPETERAQAAVLIDIEGAEFDFLEPAVIELLKSSVIIVELHPHYFSDGADRLEDLRQRVFPVFDVTTLVASARDLSGFPELAEMSDDERWLLCSEGRRRPMRWWVLEPRPGGGSVG